MVNIILNGCNGKMGREVTKCAAEDFSVKIVAGIDLDDSWWSSEGAQYPVCRKVDYFCESANFKAIDRKKAPVVVVDFSSPNGVEELLAVCEKFDLPLVLCTTGLSDAQIEAVLDASARIPILRSSNMSIGVNALLRVLRDSGIVDTLQGAGFDIEIVEKHHSQKKDAPSGTALAFADAISKGRYEYAFDRSARHCARPENEIGISCVRGGTIVGDHDIIFAGQDEVITFSHMAYSRAIFAKGAIAAAKFIAQAGPGIYDMSDALS